jgi:flagellar biosynthesis GTPase FlhF
LQPTPIKKAGAKKAKAADEEDENEDEDDEEEEEKPKRKAATKKKAAPTKKAAAPKKTASKRKKADADDEEQEEDEEEEEKPKKKAAAKKKAPAPKAAAGGKKGGAGVLSGEFVCLMLVVQVFVVWCSHGDRYCVCAIWQTIGATRVSVPLLRFCFVVCCLPKHSQVPLRLRLKLLVVRYPSHCLRRHSTSSPRNPMLRLPRTSRY